MPFQFVRTRVEIALATAVWPDADVLVLPTNDCLWMAAGPALDVKKAAGAEVELSAVRMGPIPIGENVVTGAGSLPLAGIIHAAVMGQDLQVKDDGAASAIRGSLETAVQKRWVRVLIHSLLATGHRTRPETLRSVIGSLVDSLLEGSPLREVTLLAADQTERTILHEAVLHNIQGHR